MATSPHDELRKDIEADAVTIVVGAGVSVAVTGNSPTASWVGLLRAGIDRANEFGSNLPPAWKERMEGELSYALENSYLPDLLSVADKVTHALGGHDSGEFRAWLRRDIGGLPLEKPELLAAIDGLGVPIATTNYDSLIEKALSRSVTTWMDASGGQMIIQRKSDNILHLHGHWEQPESIVLGAQSYGGLMKDTPAMYIEKILAGVRSLLFIGCGDGLEDPNFASLRDWLRKIFPGMESRHYRLCLDQELVRLGELHNDDRITPLAYGSAYQDLVPFLHGLQQSATISAITLPSSVGSTHSRAVDVLSSRVRAATVLAETVTDIEERTLKELLIPPILLPVTREEYVELLGAEGTKPPKRCNPHEDIRTSSLIVIAADETSGLTSALTWLITEASESDQSLTPILVDFRSLGAGHNPLQRQIGKELASIDSSIMPSGPLPPFALALDNLSVRPDKIFGRVVQELKSESCRFVVIGCRNGAESELIDRLRNAGLDPTLRYIGPMNNRDAVKMAKLIDPVRAEQVAAKAMEIVSRERFAPTPFTIGLLLTMLLRAEHLLSAASETALLDAYVAMLLGRGDPHEDARFDLDSFERADILASFAEMLVKSKSGSVTESAALDCFKTYFEMVGWDEIPSEVLDNLTKRRILKKQDGKVFFTQSSYLYLFAAKKAIESEGFRSFLYGDPLYYGPIVRHYAALKRSDSEVLQEVAKLLSLPSGVELTSGTTFAEVREEAYSIKATSVEELVEQLAFSETAAKELEEEFEEANTETDDPDEFDEELEYWPDVLDSTDSEPFPLDVADDGPIVKFAAMLFLVSNVLRDSDLVKDAQLKELVLHRILLMWARFAELLEADSEFQKFTRSTAREFIGEFIKGDQEKSINRFCECMPTLVASHGILANLVSNKLTKLLDSRFGDDSFSSDPGTCVMGAILAFNLQNEGWSRHFLATQAKHPRVRAVDVVLERIAYMSYYYSALSQRDIRNLREFLVNQIAAHVPSEGKTIRKDQRALIMQTLDKNRQLAQRRKMESELEDARVDDDSDYDD